MWKKIIKSSKNTKTDTNTLPVKIPSFYADVFSPAVSNLTNECFNNRVVPESLKIAPITPVFKKGDAKLTSCYRPICSLPCL